MRLKNFNLFFGSQVFKSFSEESRIRILHLIFQYQEMCISDLEHVLDFTQTKTSRHLIYLKNAGLLNSRHVDQWVFYFIKDEFQDIISQIFQFLNKDPTLMSDMETYRILFSNRELAHNKLRNKKWLP